MASINSPANFIYKFDNKRKKSYESCFPGLALPSSQNPLEEVGLHKQLSKTFDELKSREVGENSIMSKSKESFHEKVITDQNITPKSQKQKPADVKRWASVVKAQKKLQLSTDVDVSEKQHLSEDIEITSEIFDCIFKTFPKSFESHKDFFVINDKMFHCNICSLNLESVLSLSNHLKTRKHEDNAIEYFKAKLPADLYYIMEFVSFYGSNLCCNLCRCKIAMSSHNPHETIVNIMAHNSDESHVSKKTKRETCITADTVLQTLSGSCHTISENVHYIEKKMVPQFKCKLCKKIIMYDDNMEVLSQNFTSHMKSVCHLKNQKAVEVLKLFGEANMTGKDNWVVVNGNIICTYCNQEFETNLQQLISHVSDVEHATNVFIKLGISSNLGEVSGNNTLQENMMNEVKSFALKKPKKLEYDKKQFFEPISGTQPKPGCRLRELLNTMPSGLKQVDYVIENEKGSITCLVCNRVVPPTSYNLRTHLLGSKHKINMEQMKEVSQESSPTLNGTSSENLKSEATTKDNTMSLPVKSKATQNNLSGELSIKKISKPLEYTLKMDKGSVTCMICQYPLPNPNLVEEHLASDEHKNRENIWLKNCPNCSSRNPFTFRLLKALPKSLRRYKCHKIETIPVSVLNNLYSLLMNENQIIKKNENVLIKNVDGRHSYCKLCKTLIPLSLNVVILENNVVSHLKGNQHESFIRENNENSQDASNSPKAARHLFNLPEEFQKPKEDPKIYNFEDFTRLISDYRDTKTEEEENSLLTKKFSANLDKKNDEVFVFGKECDKCDLVLEDSKVVTENPKVLQRVLPVADVPCAVRFEEETNEDVLNRRQKQIEYGMNTEGYARYCKLIPRRKRSIYLPITPPKHLRCSRRTWDGMIRAWRKQLHNWDPPKSSTLDLDIRPLD